eukprot:jgi/Chrzof1/14868/Cz09g18300.t1
MSEYSSHMWSQKLTPYVKDRLTEIQAGAAKYLEHVQQTGEVDKSVADYEIGEMKNHWLLMWHIIVSKLPGSYSSYDARLAAGEAIRDHELELLAKQGFNTDSILLPKMNTTWFGDECVAIKDLQECEADINSRHQVSCFQCHKRELDTDTKFKVSRAVAGSSSQMNSS